MRLHLAAPIVAILVRIRRGLRGACTKPCQSRALPSGFLGRLLRGVHDHLFDWLDDGEVEFPTINPDITFHLNRDASPCRCGKERAASSLEDCRRAGAALTNSSLRPFTTLVSNRGDAILLMIVTALLASSHSAVFVPAEDAQWRAFVRAEGTRKTDFSERLKALRFTVATLKPKRSSPPPVDALSGPSGL